MINNQWINKRTTRNTCTCSYLQAILFTAPSGVRTAACTCASWCRASARSSTWSDASRRSLRARMPCCAACRPRSSSATSRRSSSYCASSPRSWAGRPSTSGPRSSRRTTTSIGVRWTLFLLLYMCKIAYLLLITAGIAIIICILWKCRRNRGQRHRGTF